MKPIFKYLIVFLIIVLISVHIFLLLPDFIKYQIIYKINFWFSTESRSGPGSEIKNTRVISKIIPIIVKKYNIKTILDVSCGDFNYMKKILPKIPNVKYLGLDIVPGLIKNNSTKYKKYNFTVGDITKTRLQKKFDLVIVKDLFIHLSNQQIQRALNNIEQSKSKYLLITNSRFNQKYNKDIYLGLSSVYARKVNFLINPWKLNIINKYRNDGHDQDYILVKL